jgi:uncharacterized protein (TIGR03067 family)
MLFAGFLQVLAIPEAAMRTTYLYIFAFALMAGSAFAAPASDEKDPTKEDQERIQGTWKVESGEVGGLKNPDDLLKIQLVFMAEKVISKIGDAEKKKGTFQLDATAKLKTIDVRTDDQLVHGIYKLEGDTLTICLDESGEARPAEFESKEGTKVALVVLKRVKP